MPLVLCHTSCATTSIWRIPGLESDHGEATALTKPAKRKGTKLIVRRAIWKEEKRGRLVAISIGEENEKQTGVELHERSH